MTSSIAAPTHYTVPPTFSFIPASDGLDTRVGLTFNPGINAGARLLTDARTHET
jgi:hypothetical protein